ncbi:MAG: hypothetical protein LBD01_03760 [Puniceicoccales bacterium]|nr:hypothetical protein [Puniceicoccales bacterium]
MREWLHRWRAGDHTLADHSRRLHNPPARTNCNADVESVHATIENEFFDLENFSARAHFIAMAGTYQHFYNFARQNRSRAKKTPAELLREKPPDLHPRILLLHPCLLDAHMGQLLSGPAASPGNASFANNVFTPQTAISKRSDKTGHEAKKRR